MRTTCILIISLLLSVISSPGQDPQNLKFDRITTEKIIIEKGLSQNSGLSITQDSRGFMWFGTWDGLNRFDGYEFVIYDNESGLSNNTVRSLFEDGDKNLWIATEGGLDKLDLRTGKFEIFRNVPGQYNSISSDFILEVLPGRNNDIWICTANGLNNYDPGEDVFRRISFYSGHADSSVSNFINCAYLEPEGKLWIGTNYGMHCYDLNSEQFSEFYASPGEENSLSDNRITDIIRDSGGDLWVGTASGLNRFISGGGEVVQYFNNPADRGSISHNTINVIFEDSDGTIWIGTPDKLNIFQREEDNFIRQSSQNDNTSLSNDDVRDIFEDRTGTIWIGTYKGINKIDKSSSRFTHYKHIPGDPTSLSNDIIYNIIEDGDGNAWFATYGGLNRMDRETNEFFHYRALPGNRSWLISDKLRAIVLDRDGLLWIGTENSGLQSFDRNSNTFNTWLHDPHDSTSIIDNRIVSLGTDLQNRLWIGTRNGLDVMNIEDFSIEHRLNDPLNENAVHNPVIWCLRADREGNMWVGTDDGLLVYNQELEITKRYRHIPSDANSLSGNRIMTVNQDSDGNMWVGTIGDGLNFIDLENNIITSYNEKDGLPNNVVYSALEDEEGNIWISTNWGLTKFDRKNRNFIRYNVEDGIQGNEFNGGAYYKNEMGEMYFGGMNGFNLFHPSGIKINEVPPIMVITGFRIFNEPVPGPFLDGDTIILSYRDNFFSIEFAALEYTNPAKNTFRYKLENYDDDWITHDASLREADYKKVSPGTYIFHVIGANNDGIWNNEGVSMVIIVTPPWYETWIFRISFAVFVILSFWSIIFWRFKTLKRKHEVERRMLEIEKQIFELEQKALRLQMNPHFIFNSLNAIQSFVIANDTDKAIPYLAKFSHLMRMILANSSEPFIPLKDELRALKYYMDLEKLRFDDSFDYRIRLGDDIDEDFIEIPPMILQPYVENAIIHGLNHKEERGHLELTFELQKRSLICIIEDNGIGREKANEIRERSGIRRQPRGMMITRERLELMKKQNKEDFTVVVEDLKDEKGVAAGTRVKISMHFREI